MIRFKYTDKIPPFLRNKYILTLIVFFVWLTFFDSNNLISTFKEKRNLKRLEADKEYYTNQIKEDKKKLRNLKTNNRDLEKFAREQYRMKKPDEDLYILLTPHENRQINRRNN